MLFKPRHDKPGPKYSWFNRQPAGEACPKVLAQSAKITTVEETQEILYHSTMQVFANVIDPILWFLNLPNTPLPLTLYGN